MVSPYTLSDEQALSVLTATVIGTPYLHDADIIFKLPITLVLQACIGSFSIISICFIAAACITISGLTFAYSKAYWDFGDDGGDNGKDVLVIFADAAGVTAGLALGAGPFSYLIGAAVSTVVSRTVSEIEGDADVWTCPIADAALCADARAVGQAHNFAMDRASDYNDQSLVWWGGTAEENEAAFQVYSWIPASIFRSLL